MMKGSVKADFHDYSVKVTDLENNRQLHYSFNNEAQSFSLQASKTSQYQICIHNVGHTVLKVNFVYDSGAINEIPQMQDLKEMNTYIRHYNQSISALKAKQQDLLKGQESRAQKLSAISGNIIFFSATTIFLMALGTTCQSLRASRMIELKKRI